MHMNAMLQKISSMMIVTLVVGVVGGLAAGDATAAVRSAYTSNVDEPARVPYLETVRQFCFTSNRECDFTVPAGKRLAIQYASGYFSSSTNANYVFAAIRQAGDNIFFLPTSNQGCGGDINCPISFYVFNEAVQAVYEPGEEPVVRISKGNNAYPVLNGVNPALPQFNNVTLSGYLIDCVAVVCQPVEP